MAYTTSPNMSLPIPGVGSEQGPQYGFDINTSLTLIDQHDHSPGRGVQITPAGININTALNFNDNPATNLEYESFIAQTTPTLTIQSVSVALASTINELFYTDNNGTQTQITKNGQVNSIAASIPGESYAAGTFYWTQTQSSLPTTPANFDIGSITLRPNVASTTNGVTLIPPSSVATTFTFPSYDAALTGTLPSTISFVTMTSTGDMSATISTAGGITGSMLANNTVTRNQLAAVGQISSSNSGDNPTSSSSFSFVNIPLTCTITIASPAVISMTVTQVGYPISIYNNQVVQFTTTGSLPTGIIANTSYYIQNVSGSSGAVTFNIAATPNGTPINTTGTQSGTQTCHLNLLSITITTTGRPVILMLVPDSSTGNPGTLFVGSTSATIQVDLSIELYNDNNLIYLSQFSTVETGTSTALTIPPGSVNMIDTTVVGSPGTYTYNVKIASGAVSGTPSGGITSCKLVVYEL